MIIGNLTYRQFIQYISNYITANCKNIYRPQNQTNSGTTVTAPDREEGTYVINPHAGNNDEHTVVLAPGLYELALVGGGGNRHGDEYWGKWFYFYGASGGSGSGVIGYFYLYENCKVKLKFGSGSNQSTMDYIKSENSSMRLATAGQGGNGGTRWIFSGDDVGGAAGTATFSGGTDIIITEDLDSFNGNRGQNGEWSPGGKTIGPVLFGENTSYLWGEGISLSTTNAVQNGGGYLKFIKKGRHKLDIPDYMREGDSVTFTVQDENDNKRTILVRATCKTSVEETTEEKINTDLINYLNNIGITNLDRKITAGTYFDFLYDLLIFCNCHLGFLSSQFDTATYLVYRENVDFEYKTIGADAVNKLIEADDINYLLKNLFEYMKGSIRSIVCQYDYFLVNLLEQAEGEWSGYLQPGVYKFSICGAIGSNGVGYAVHKNGGVRWVYTTYPGGGGFAEFSVYLPQETFVEIKSWPRETGNYAYVKINNVEFARAYQGENGGTGVWSGNGGGGSAWIIDAAQARLLGYPLKGSRTIVSGIGGAGSSVCPYGNWGSMITPSGGCRVEYVRKDEKAYPV